MNLAEDAICEERFLGTEAVIPDVEFGASGMWAMAFPSRRGGGGGGGVWRDPQQMRPCSLLSSLAGNPSSYPSNLKIVSMGFWKEAGTAHLKDRTSLMLVMTYDAGKHIANGTAVAVSAGWAVEKRSEGVGHRGSFVSLVDWTLRSSLRQRWLGCV